MLRLNMLSENSVVLLLQVRTESLHFEFLNKINIVNKNVTKCHQMSQKYENWCHIFLERPKQTRAGELYCSANYLRKQFIENLFPLRSFFFCF
jgi:hypothetical protein